MSESISSGAVDAELLTGAAAAASGFGGQVFKAFSELLDTDIKRVVDKIIERFLD